MSDTTTTADDTAQTSQTADGEGEQTTETGAEQQEVDYKAEAEKWKALSQKNEARAKANAEKAKRLDELDEANKTELQKATDRATQLEKDAADAKLEAQRARISAQTGVPEDLLFGSTPEEIQKAADAAIAFKGTQNTASRVGGADISGGAAKPVIYTREQIKDPEFYKNHRDDILAAQSQGRITS